MHRLSGPKFTFFLAPLLFALSFSISAQQEICELVFETCPEHFDGDTIDVPIDVMALSAQVRACDMLEVDEGIKDSITPASVFFIIDQSGSMWYWHGADRTEPPRDSLGSRFLVTSALLDSLLDINPKTNVGLALFGTFLWFDPQDDEVFKQPPGYGNSGDNMGAYIPLLQLDSTYSEYGNRTGYDILKYYLQTQWVENIEYIGGVEALQPEGYRAQNIRYHPTTDTLSHGGTNITAGFDAAKDAMALSPHQSENQFLIFLSDGEANMPANNTEIRDRFIQGENVPTTFTIFLHPDGVAPDQLYTMTTNIQNNNYSTSNTSSDLWAIQTDYNVLMNLLFDHVVTPFISTITGNPYRLQFNRTVASPAGDNEFLFTERFPLNPEMTSLQIEISYTITESRTGLSRDTTTVSTLYLRRTESMYPPAGFGFVCWDRANLEVQYDGEQVTQIRENMDQLDLVFNSGGDSFSHVQIQVSNEAENHLDLEQINLTDQGNGIWTASFPRAIDNTPTPGDGTLQHLMNDSIIVTWRNPEIPLDTIRIALPFNISRSIEITSAGYFDSDADGFIDSIYVEVDNSIPEQDLEYFISQMQLPAHRGFTIDSAAFAPGGIGLYVTETATTSPATSVTPEDAIINNDFILPNGGYVPAATVTIQDNVAPVIKSARLISGPNLDDTLVVTFSESISPIIHTRPFLFSSGSGQEYTAQLQIESVTSTRLRFVITEVEGLGEFEGIMNKDSIWIYTLAEVSDQINNIQSNPNNRRVSLSVKSIPYTVAPRTVNNPFNPNQSVIPEFIRQLDPQSRSTGIVVAIEPEVPLKPYVHLRGTASVYDVVKNPMIEDEEMIYDPQRKRLYFIWDGTNRNGRIVASGTYTVIMNIEDNLDEGTAVKIINRIGVKR